MKDTLESVDLWFKLYSLETGDDLRKTCKMCVKFVLLLFR